VGYVRRISAAANDGYGDYKSNRAQGKSHARSRRARQAYRAGRFPEVCLSSQTCTWLTIELGAHKTRKARRA